MAPGVIWTKEECENLNRLVEHHGKKWTPISTLVGGGKTGKQCRRQWERLNTCTKQCGWSPEEDRLLLEFHARHGNKWTLIARLIGGRTDNAVKNRFHALMTKNKAKLLARLDSSKTSDTTMSGRSLKQLSSLERLRALRQEQEHRMHQLEQARLKALKEVEGSETSNSVLIKGEAPQTTGHYSTYDNAWGHFSGNPEAWVHGPSGSSSGGGGGMQCSSPPYSFVQLDGYARAQHEAMNDDDGTRGGYLVGNGRLHHHDLQPVMVPGNQRSSQQAPADDVDSMESSSENKTATTNTATTTTTIPTECASGYYACDDMRRSLATGTSSNPLPSRVLDNGRIVEPLDSLYDKGRSDNINPDYGSGYSIPCTSLSMDAMQPQTMKIPDLSVDLSFSLVDNGFDFESCLHTISPISPSSYLKYLNSTMSPVHHHHHHHHQASSISDQQTRMEA